MRNATKITVSTFGVVMGLAGIEHGIGEILQGNTTPGGLVIQSWPGSAFFEIMAGEPAMTIVPNLLVTGILAVLSSLLFILWAARFIHRVHGGPVLMLLSIVMLLVGGGFGPPVMGIILSAAATRIHAPWAWWRRRLPMGLQRALAKSWRWSFIAGLIAWLLLMPGANLLAYFFCVDNPNLVPVLFFFALGFLLLTFLTGFAWDIQRGSDSQQALTKISGRAASQAAS